MSVSKFHFKKGALKDGEKIKLFYWSAGPDFNRDLKYYYQAIVISQASGDTVNILTLGDFAFTIKDTANVYRYLSENNLATKVLQLDLEDTAQLKNLDVEGLKRLDPNAKEPEKVVYAPGFLNVARNNYATVIGVIGNVPATDDSFPSLEVQ